MHAPLVSASAVTGPVSAPLLLSDTAALHLGPAPRQHDLLAPDRHICRDSSSKAGHAVAFQVEVNLGGATEPSATSVLETPARPMPAA